MAKTISSKSIKVARLLLSIFFFSTLLCFSHLEAYPGESFLSIEQLSAEADLIVEGTVLEYSSTADRKVQGYVGQSQDTVIFEMGENRESLLKIEQIFKGKPLNKNEIRVFASPDIAYELTKLVVGKKYILFLKERKLKDGYIILEGGRAQWRIFDYGGIAKIKEWSKTEILREADAYQNYDAFAAQLIRTISQK